MKHLKYKALILDVDGALLPNKEDGKPSEKVAKIIAKVKDKIHIGVATSRPLFRMSDIFDQLQLSGPSIINAGAQIVDSASKKILFNQAINIKDMTKVIKIALSLNLPIILQDNGTNIPYVKGYKPKNLLMIWFRGLNSSTGEEFLNKVSHIPTIAIHKTISWDKDKIDILITHAYATKQHAILELAKLLNINTHEIIGVGDGYNDFPLLMACGLKVAMGNAVDDLKAIADYIAPTVEEDGVVNVINKFILMSK